MAPLRALITGGAGFIGCNLADRLLTGGARVAILDNLSRPGSELNVAWLKERHGTAIEVIDGDVRDRSTVVDSLRERDAVFHLSGQTAVTVSITDPEGDFGSNLVGTLNVLEAARHAERPPTVVYSSTNKVYGPLTEVGVVESGTRYEFETLKDGIDESQPLSFDSPYACSKGAADQYALTYARLYGLPIVVFRQSCIYGPRQMGVEDQGWVAWFAAASAFDLPLRIFGDGKQVRDLLFIDDLVDAFEAALQNVDRAAGNAYNVGGGPSFAVSVWDEFRSVIEDAVGSLPTQVDFADWRPGDQRVFYCDIRKAKRDLGWEPRTPPRDGVDALVSWIKANASLFTS